MSVSTNTGPGHPPPPPAGHRAGRTLLLLAVVFVLPVIVGAGLFWSGWRPANFGNHGELLQPVRPLPESGLLASDGSRLATEGLRGKWLLVLPVRAGCDLPCQQALQEMRQIHVALNKEQTRLRRVLVSEGGGPADAEVMAWPAVQKRFPQLLLTRLEDPASLPWRRSLDDFRWAVLVIDPQGRVMMRHPLPLDGGGLLADLERLLKYSWVR